MLPVLTRAQMQQVDRETIDGLGLPGAVLMESAGRAVVQAIRDCPDTSGCRRPVILCGKGNNGGDGFVVARYLLPFSRHNFPEVFLCGTLQELQGDALTMARVAVKCGVRVIELDEEKLHLLAPALSEADLVVDALLGSGSSGAPRGLIARVIEMLGEYQAPVVAVDCPSGVDMDTGAVPGATVYSAVTVTFGFEKIGHRLYPGRSHCGKIIVADIGFPELALAKVNCQVFVSESSDISHRLPLREKDSHKGDYGRLLVLGGSTGLTGAPVMACETALACGAGLVTAGVPASLNPIFEMKLTEAMSRPFFDNGTGYLQPESLPEIEEFLGNIDVLALGPGLGRDEGTVRLVLELASKVKIPAVIDADGLNALARDLSKLSLFSGPVVITPHPGEMSRLSGLTIPQIKASPVETARDFSARLGVVVLLKGAPSVVAEPGGRVILNPTGGPALAKGGSGDVLTGAIAALLAQGMGAFDAAFCGAYLHGRAGDMAAESLGEYSVLASDITAFLPPAIQEVRGGLE